MTDKQAVSFLRCPASAVVDLAVEMANLSWKEALAIDLCGRKGLTQERASEQVDCSVDSMQKWYRAGIKKLTAAWSGVWWIEKLAKE